MVRAHRQAWAWQDEWVGLTIDDIRELEAQTQEALAEKMDFDSENDSPCEEIVRIYVLSRKGISLVFYNYEHVGDIQKSKIAKIPFSSMSWTILSQVVN